MKVRHLVPGLTLVLALVCLPVLAQGHRGGGSRGGSGGGSRGGYGGSAVARHPSAGPRSGAVGGMHYGSRPGYAPRGSVAQQRHPRAGTGYARLRLRLPPRPRLLQRRPSLLSALLRLPTVLPYYPYYYWPGVSLSFGWGYGSSWPYYAAATTAALATRWASTLPTPPRAVTTAAHRLRRRAMPSARTKASGRVRLEVRPDDTSVYVDDEFRGTAREARIMNLPPGRHMIELVRPGFAIERREVTVVSGESQDVLVELLRP